MYGRPASIGDPLTMRSPPKTTTNTLKTSKFISFDTIWTKLEWRTFFINIFLTRFCRWPMESCVQRNADVGIVKFWAPLIFLRTDELQITYFETWLSMTLKEPLLCMLEFDSWATIRRSDYKDKLNLSWNLHVIVRSQNSINGYSSLSTIKQNVRNSLSGRRSQKNSKFWPPNQNTCRLESLCCMSFLPHPIGGGGVELVKDFGNEKQWGKKEFLEGKSFFVWRENCGNYNWKE